MRLKGQSFESPDDNILFDEVLLNLAERGKSDEVMRFWESPVYFIVLGRIGKVEDEINISEVKKGVIPVLRRCSGGGTVLQGPGCLNYSFVFSKEKTSDVADLRGSYEFILGKLSKALKSLNVDATYLPISDIALTDSLKKFSGNAQKRSRSYILHHGTLLYNFDLPLISKYLAHPKVMPDYRQNRIHLDFVDNLNVDTDHIKECIQKEFGISMEDKQILNSERLYLEELKEKNDCVLKIS